MKFVLLILFALISATVICINESSVSINEDQGSLMFTINLTNPSSTDMTITVVTTDRTAAGETLHAYVHT